MKSETEIRRKLQDVNKQLDKDTTTGHDQSHLIGQRNILEWVLEDTDNAN